MLEAHLSTLHSSVAVLAGRRVGKAKLHFFIVLLCPVLTTLDSRTAALALVQPPRGKSQKAASFFS